MRRRIVRNALMLAVDVSIAVAAFVAAYATVYAWPLRQVPGIEEKTLSFAAIAVLSFVLLGQFRGSWRYVSIPDLITIIKATALAVVAYTVAAFLLTRGQNVPRSVLVLTFIYMVAGLTGIRLVYRITLERLLPGVRFAGRHGPRKNVLLCGMTDLADSFIRSQRRHSGSDLAIVGMLDDSSMNHGRHVQGVTVLGGLADLERVLARLERRGVEIDEIVVTEQSPGRRRLAEIVEIANNQSLSVSRIPSANETSLVTSNSLLTPRPIELGDLLERPEVTADLDSVARLISGRVVLATGAGGSIGSELCRQIASFEPKRLILTDSSEYHLYLLDTELRDRHPELDIVSRLADVRDARRVGAVFAECRPEVVFHAAALKHVPLVEDNALEAIKTNVLGTRNVADAALANECDTFVMISTDKAVNPTSVMGATKRAAEAYCQALDVRSQRTRFKTVRFGNVLGSNGSVVPRFQEQIMAGGPVTVTHPQVVRYFMTIPEAVRLVLHACAHALGRQTERGKIMVLDMGKPVRIVDLAERVIQLAGYKPRVDIDIVFTGLRPGEKLYEELFDPSEMQDGRTEDGYVIASPRITDRALLERSLKEIEGCLEREDGERALRLLGHIVPEFDRSAPKRVPDIEESELGLAPVQKAGTDPLATSH